jgi:hypothetical protein
VTSPSHISADLLARVAELRREAFALVGDIPRSDSRAAVRMQSVANELGVIEELLAAAAANGFFFELDAA